jgi:large subunit ribosomal protein L24
VRIRKGDRVRVIAGKWRGTEGEVVRALPARGRVVVEGVAVAKRHTKPRDASAPGGIIDKPMPIDVSNVMIICRSCGPTRIGMRVGEDGRRTRVCRRCGGEL